MSKKVIIRRRGKYFEFRFEIASINGKRKWLSRSGYLDENIALEEGKKALEEYENAGDIFSPSIISYNDFLDQWLSDSKGILKPKTLEAYNTIARLYIKPQIGHFELCKITPRTLSRFIKKIINENTFSKSYYYNILKVVKTSFREACETYEYIDRSPASELRLPKTLESEEHKTNHIYTLEEVDLIMERFKNNEEFLLAFNIARLTGLRTGEVFALTWQDIDFDNNNIMVRHTTYPQNKDEKGRWFLGPTKTSNGVREIPLLPSLKEILVTHKKKQDYYKKELGNLYINYHLEDVEYKGKRLHSARIVKSDNKKYDTPMDFIITKEDGRFTGTDVIKYPSKIIKKELNIDCRFYDHRKTFATELYYVNSNEDTIKNLMGHNDIKITKEYYITEKKDIVQEAKEQAMLKAEANLLTDKMTSAIANNQKIV